MTWENLMMYLATIPKHKTGKPEEDKIISPEDEQAELRKTLGL